MQSKDLFVECKASSIKVCVWREREREREKGVFETIPIDAEVHIHNQMPESIAHTTRPQDAHETRPQNAHAQLSHTSATERVCLGACVLACVRV